MPDRLTQSLPEAMADFIFPPLCVACASGVDTVPSLCQKCLAAIIELQSPVCLYCERELLGANEYTCCDQRLPLYAFARYEPPVSECLRRFKFYGLSYIADLASERLAQRWNAAFSASGVSALVPVPLWRWREKRRGFNQSEIFSKRLGERLQCPSESLLLHRVKGGRPQSRTKARDRELNVRGIFETDIYEEMPSRVVLVDDIVTTGATMREGIKTLKAGSITVAACVSIGLHSEFASA